MRRREVIKLLGAAAAVWPLAARAQQSIPVIGFLNSVSPGPSAPFVSAFHHGLGSTGFVEGQNVAMEYRWAEGDYKRLPAMAADLVRRQVSVIATTGGGPSAVAAKAATTTIPIVFQIGGDPVETGLVTSLGKPSGNLTGVTNLGVELGAKQLETMHELMPPTSTIGVLVNPSSPNAEVILKNLEAAAKTLGRKIHFLPASNDAALENAFVTLHQMGAGALMISTDPFFNNRNQQLAQLAFRFKTPAIFQFAEFTAAGGLMAYGGSRTDVYRIAGVYTGRILKGEKPADLPVMQATKVELIINLKTAKALGLTVPLSLLGRADEIIE